MKGKPLFSKRRRRLLSVFITAMYCISLVFTGMPVMAAPGDIVPDNFQSNGLTPSPGYFAFEVEVPLGSLKDEPTWNELEQMLDNPYAFTYDSATPGNFQGFPSYRTNIMRRQSFIFLNGVEQTHEQFLTHPLNYNHVTGEEMRLLNAGFPGVPWRVPNQLILIEAENTDSTRGPLGVPVYEWTYRDVDVTPGADRIDAGEAPIDYNSPVKPDSTTAIISAEAIPVEGGILIGGDPGEPNYFGFGQLDNNLDPQGYSMPAVPLAVGATSGNILNPAVDRLYDPERGLIQPRDPVTGIGGLRKPSLRVPPWGTGTQPGFTVNSEANLAADPAALVPSNENDYVAGVTLAEKQIARGVAMALGKALFWDMQVGSDGVQSCGTCHFHAGVDNRTKNQLNPNHLGGDLTLQIGHTASLPDGSQPANQEVQAFDFPFHKLADESIPGEPLLNPGNVLSDVNDVMSSMGVLFGKFFDIPAPGGPGVFTPAFNGVASVMPDLRSPNAVDNVDPIPVFRGFRRVEPRNTPTFFAVTMNFDNFWDGRARHDFNGGSVFGPSDPQSHVMVDDGTGLQATRQIIRFVSLASLATGPGLSDFEMSFAGRNWAKIGKKLLQSGVVPLANQLVDPTDSILGPYSGQRSTVGGPVDMPGRPGLNVSYNQLIQMAFHASLWQNTNEHFNGTTAVSDPGALNGVVTPAGSDPFDGYVLSLVDGPADPVNTNQFTQMEANFSLFWGLSIHLWGTILVPDDTPFDQFLDNNPSAFLAFGESGEPNLVFDLPNIADLPPNPTVPYFKEIGNFKRDPGLIGDGSNGSTFISSGTRQSGAPDPLMGMDFFLGSNLSLKNPNFRSLRCGECHAANTLTDHTVIISHQLSFLDFAQEFAPGQPGTELTPEPLGKDRIISGFALEGELQENAQDALERNVADFDLTPVGFPQASAFLDNGMYNLGVRPISEDLGRGGLDAWGWPLSLAALAMKNLAGADFNPGGDNPNDGFAQPPAPGIPIPNFDPDNPEGYGLFEESPQDQEINPGFGEEPINPLLPPHLAPFASNMVVGDAHPEADELGGAPGGVINTLTGYPMLEGFIDAMGPFNPAAVVGEALNNAPNAPQMQMGTWPNVNRVQRMGAFKAPALRNVELTGPYFHTGSKLTLRQELDFYDRGGDFPITNSAHRDFLLVDLDIEDEALGGLDPVTGITEFTEAEKEHIKESVIEFLLELTDARVKFERAPFDHPEIFVPLDGTAPENTFGRQGFLNNLANGMFMQVPASGSAGISAPLANFMGVSSIKGDPGIDHFDSIIPIPPMPPVANNQSVVTNEDTPIGVNLVAVDVNIDPLTFSIVTPPAHGTLTGTGPNRTYNPALNYNGPDSFTFRANDGTFNSNTATVSITVTPVNDAPIAVNNSYIETATLPLNIAAPGVLGNDTDADGNPLTAVLVSGPVNPNVTLALNPNGSFTFTYPYNVIGFLISSFTYRANDGLANSNLATVTVRINQRTGNPIALNNNALTPVNTAANINVAANDTDLGGSINLNSIQILAQPANGNVTVLTGANAGRVLYTPNTGFRGNNIFTYTIRDNLGNISNIATVTVLVF